MITDVEYFKRDIQKLIAETLNSTLALDKKAKGINQKLLKKDTAEKAIMEHYKLKGAGDFQSELKNMVVMTLNSKDITASLDREIFNKEKEEAKKKLNAQTLDINQEESKQIDKNKSDINLNAVGIKVAYTDMLEKYQSLRKSLYTGVNGQVKTGELTVGDRMSRNLLCYENTLRKLDIAYRAETGAFIGQDDEQVGKLENDFLRDNLKSQDTVNNIAEKNLDNIQRLNGELDDISDRIVELSVNKDDFGIAKFQDDMDYLQKEYEEKQFELRSLQPDMNEMHRQTTELEISDEYNTKVLGTEYSKYKGRRVISTRNNSLKEKTGLEKTEINESTKEEKEEIYVQNLSSADTIIEEFENSIDDPNVSTEKLGELLQSASMMVGSNVSLRNNTQNSSKSNPNVNYWRSAVESEENVATKDIEREKMSGIMAGIKKDLKEKNTKQR